MGLGVFEVDLIFFFPIQLFIMVTVLHSFLWFLWNFWDEKMVLQFGVGWGGGVGVYLLEFEGLRADLIKVLISII